MAHDPIAFVLSQQITDFNTTLEEFIEQKDERQIGILCARYHAQLVDYLFNLQHPIWSALQKWSESYIEPSKKDDPNIDLYEEGMEVLEAFGLSDLSATTLSYLWAIQLSPEAETTYVETLRGLVYDGEYNAYYLPPALRDRFNETDAEIKTV